MIIRCPNCEFSRSISPDRIPPNSELATCPKCKQRFRFRTLEHLRREPVESMPRPEAAPPGKVQKADLWDALDSFNKNLDLQEKNQGNKFQNPKERAEQEKTSKDDYYIPNFVEEKNENSDQEPRLPIQEIPLLKVKTQEKTQKKYQGKAQGKTQAKTQEKTQEKHVQMSLEGYENEEYENEEYPEEKQNKQSKQKIEYPEENLNQTDYPDEAEYPEENLNQTDYPDDAESQSQSSANFKEKFDQGLNLGEEPSEIYEELDSTIISPTDQSSLEKSQAWEAEKKQAKRKDFKLHSYEDSPPEEKVEQDLLLLHSDEEKPVRDLGLLREVKEEETQEETQEEDIYWENPDKYGWLSSFFRTGKEVMFSAPSFFKKNSTSNSLSFSFLFFIINSYFSILCILLWSHIAALVLAIPKLKTMSSSLPTILMLTPVALGLLLILAAGSTRMLIQLMQKDQKIKFYDSCRLLSYSVSPLILSIIPFIGPIAGGLWSLVSLCTGARYLYDLPWHKAFAATMPTIIIIVMSIYFMA